MGTRADFYVGVGEQAEWLGSIAWDGYPDGLGAKDRTDSLVLAAQDEGAYRSALHDFLAARDDSTLPERGWPWPWDTSGTTDYAYFFMEGKVLGSSFGGPLFDPLLPEPDEDDETSPKPVGASPILPDMSARKNVRFDKGSGILIFGG